MDAADEIALADALAVARRITQTHGTSYYLASRLLTRPKQDAIYALYGFVRTADDIVDCPGIGDAAERLEAFVEAWHRALAEGRSTDPVLHAAQWVVRTYHIPPAEIDAFLVAMRQDLSVTRYATYVDLEGYMYGSAAVIGRMLTRIFGVTEEETFGYAQALGDAMQLTNFLRDLREDFEVRGRIYLPQEDLARFGITEEHLAAHQVTPAFQALLQFEIARARALYARADLGIPRLPADVRPAIALARLLYAKILDRIEQAHYDVFSERHHVPTALKAWYALPLLAPEIPRRAFRSFVPRSVLANRVL